MRNSDASKGGQKTDPGQKTDEKEDLATRLLGYLNWVLDQIRPVDLFTPKADGVSDEAAKILLQSGECKFHISFALASMDSNGTIRQKIAEMISIAKKLFNDVEIFKEWKDDINKRKQRYRKQHYGDYNIDLKSDKWAPPTDKNGNPLSGSANVYKGMDKAGIGIVYEEFSERMRVKHESTAKIMDEDELNTFILRTMLERFGFEARDEHIRRTLQLKCFEPENRFNERKQFFDLFEAQHDPSYDELWLDDAIKVLNCEDTLYNRDAARRLFVGHIQLLYSPGSDLQSRSTLIGAQGAHKSTFTKILAGNTNCKVGDHGIEFVDPLRWYANVPIYSEYYKNPVNRYAACNGKGVIEDAEMTGRSKTEVDHIKNDITTVVDSRRPLFKNSGKDRPRWYDVVSTTNRDRYNLEAENRRDRGIEVGIINNDLFLKLYARMYASIVGLVKRGKLDAIPDPRLDNEARTEARKRIFKSDLMDILECAFAFTHIPVIEHQTGDQKVEALKKVIDKIAAQPAEYDEKDSDEKPNIALVAAHKEQKSRLMRRWKLSYTDRNDGKRVYMTHRSGLMQFAEDYKWFYHKSNIIVKNDLVADALDKLTIEISDSLHYSWSKMDRKTTERAVMFRETIRGHYFEVENGDIPSLERKANEYLKANEDFINAAIHGKWLISM